MKKIIILTITCLLLAYLNGYCFAYLNEQYFHYENSSENNLKDLHPYLKFATAVLIAPFIETGIFQYLFLEVLAEFDVTNKRKIPIASILFALTHFYHYLYVVMTFFVGLIINYYYCEIKKLSPYAFGYTFGFHSFYNLTIYLFIYFDF